MGYPLHYSAVYKLCSSHGCATKSIFRSLNFAVLVKFVIHELFGTLIIQIFIIISYLIRIGYEEDINLSLMRLVFLQISTSFKHFQIFRGKGTTRDVPEPCRL